MPAHVTREFVALVPLLRRGNYLVVEDTIVNGHPVRPEFGPGPLEAIQTYLTANLGKLAADVERKTKLGGNFAYRVYYRVN